MQRLSLGSPAGRPRPSAAGEGADEKATKAVVRAAAAAPDKSIHLVPVLTLLCFLVLFLLSHDPSAAALTDSPVLAVTARSLEAAAARAGAEILGPGANLKTAAGAATASVGTRGGVYRRLKEDHDHGRRLQAARQR